MKTKTKRPRGRPVEPVKTGKMTITLPLTTKAAVSQAAAARGLLKSQFVRMAIEEKLQRDK